MKTNKNAHLPRKQSLKELNEEIVEANFGLETIQVWVNKKAEEAQEAYRHYEGNQRIQKSVLNEFEELTLERIKWSKHHSLWVRAQIKNGAIAFIISRS
tara:strand:- start:2072 stop:2368 length:297 start_codon:yes stop_codon:yes gene_type:complete